MVYISFESMCLLFMHVQTTVLDEAAQAHPDSWWWLKADGCDVTEGLIESTKLQWSGDVDLNDGSLQKQYEAYRKRLAFAESVGLDGEHSDVVGQLTSLTSDISEDLEFIHSGKKSNYCNGAFYNYLIMMYFL